MKKTLVIVFIAATLLLAACGSGSRDVEVPATPTSIPETKAEPTKAPEQETAEPTMVPALEPALEGKTSTSYMLVSDKGENSTYTDFVIVNLNEDNTCSVGLPASSDSNDTKAGKYETKGNKVILHIDGCEDIYFEKNDDSLVFDVEATGRTQITDKISLSTGAELKLLGALDDWDVAGKVAKDEQTLLEGIVAFEAQVVRTNGYVDGAKYPKTVVITNRAELDAYYNENKGIYNLGTKEALFSNFIKNCEKYDDAFFAENNLVLIVLESGSGSVRYEINGVNKKDNTITVSINPKMPDIGTADMAEWHVILEVSKKDVSKDTKVEVTMISVTTKETIGNETIGGLKLEINLKEVPETKAPITAEAKKAGVSYGKVTHFTYESKTTGLTRGANILLPADYDASKEYPVLYFLHGIFGDENSIPGDAGNRVTEITANLKAGGYIDDIIVVFPNMFAKTDPAAMPAFSAEGVWPYDNFINDLVNDLIPYVEANYSVKKDRNHRGLVGFSMGGRETLYIGTRRSDLFSAIGCFAPAPGVTPGKDGFMSHEGQLTEDELVVAMQDEYPLDLLMVCCGTRDGVVGKFPESYHEILTKNGVEHLWYEVPGADHDNTTIKSGYYNYLIRWGKLMAE